VNKIVLYNVESNVWEEANTPDSLIQPSYIDEEEMESWHLAGILLLSQESVKTLGNMMRRRTSGGCFGRMESVHQLHKTMYRDFLSLAHWSHIQKVRLLSVAVGGASCVTVFCN
jgi:hypothetical protein